MVNNHNTKNILLSEMLFHASRRTLILQSMILSSDSFKRDELYLKLRKHGSHFLASREKLLALNNDKKEKFLLDKQRQFSLLTATKQNELAQLLIEGDDHQAKRLISDIIASQENVLDTLKSISLYLNNKGRHSHHDSAVQLHNNRLITLVLTLSIILAIIIIAGIYYKNTQHFIHALKTSFKKVKNSESRERNIRDMMIDSVIIIDHRGLITEFNKAAEKDFGYSKDEIIGQSINLLMTSADKSHHDQYMHNYMQTGKSAIIGMGREVIVKRRDNTTFFADISVSKISHVTPPLFMGIIHNVSERKENELQLIQRQNDLEQRVKQRTEELAQANIKLSQQANYDALTGLANRYMLFDRLKYNLTQAKRHDCKLAILFIDLDGFKEINDQFGHDTGDKLLQKVAKCLMECLREEDTIARLGGDEFSVILHAVKEVKFVPNVAEKIIDSINQPIDIDGHNCSVTASIGISLYPQNGTDPDELLKQADIAMYQSKNKGKNTYTLFENNNTEKT